MENRIKDILEQDEKIKAFKLREQEIYKRLESCLTDEQLKIFNDYIAATLEMEADIEKLHYQQGMKDLFAIFKALS